MITWFQGKVDSKAKLTLMHDVILSLKYFYLEKKRNFDLRYNKNNKINIKKMKTIYRQHHGVNL